MIKCLLWQIESKITLSNLRENEANILSKWIMYVKLYKPVVGGFSSPPAAYLPMTPPHLNKTYMV